MYIIAAFSTATPRASTPDPTSVWPLPTTAVDTASLWPARSPKADALIRNIEGVTRFKIDREEITLAYQSDRETAGSAGASAMSNADQVIDPGNPGAINARAAEWARPSGSVTPIEIERIVIDADAIDALPDLVADAAAGGPVLLVMDHTPMVRAGGDLKATVESALRRRLARLTVRRLPDEPGAELHADIDVSRQLANELDDVAAVVSLGSGTVTDVAKYARHLAIEPGTGGPRRLPLICVPTAATVTAYTSSLAVLNVDGVKRTLPARPPNTVVVDVQTIADAPIRLTRAGFGDVLARSVAYGDWYLASQLGMDDGFSEVPARLLEDAERRMVEQAERIGRGEPAGVRTLTDAILLAGMAMSLVSQTAPISGWEHVISHFLDMTATHDGREPALHGAQVGVATIVAARTYERAWFGEDGLDFDRLADPFSADRMARYRAHVEQVFAWYDPSGRMAAEVWRECETKLARWRSAASAREAFVSRRRSGEIDAFVREAVRSPDYVEDALARAGAARRFADLEPPVPAESARLAVRFAHLIRARFTLGDLLDLAGWLDEARAGELLVEHGT